MKRNREMLCNNLFMSYLFLILLTYCGRRTILMYLEKLSFFTCWIFIMYSYSVQSTLGKSTINLHNLFSGENVLWFPLNIRKNSTFSVSSVEFSRCMVWIHLWSWKVFLVYDFAKKELIFRCLVYQLRLNYWLIYCLGRQVIQCAS